MTVRSAATALRPYLPREWSARVGLPRTAEVDLADKLGKVVIVVLFTLLAVRMGRDFLETARITGLLLLTGELLVVALTVLRRPAMVVDRSWRARLLTGCSLVGPPLVAPLASGGLLSDTATAIASALGLLITIAGKLTLGRSFGLMPANRGIVCTGLYRAVRHPIYAGYLVTHIGFLIAHPSPWNIGVILIADAALLARAVREERTLARDPEYLSYLEKVRWRVLPGVF
ncbi:MAG TPA: methyltransferase [Vicinamibacterales bacterium]|jgi:protein-S-isoprenylcysteine O-methyltransferase Ste14|nr:methyltransferase [Vicinamibacterales bacterium]